VRKFRAFWGVKISTTTKNMATVKAFFRRVESNGWVEKNRARLIKEKNTRRAYRPLRGKLDCDRASRRWTRRTEFLGVDRML